MLSIYVINEIIIFIFYPENMNPCLHWEKWGIYVLLEMEYK